MLDKLRGIFFLWVLSLAFQSAVAQKYTFSEDPDKFINEIHEQIVSRQKVESSEMSAIFQSFWLSGSLNENHKKEFIEIIKAASNKRLPSVPYYTYNMELIHNAITKQNIQGTDLDTLFNTILMVLKNYDKKDIDRFYTTTRKFLIDQTLFSSTGYTLKVKSSNFRIKYIDRTPPPIEDNGIDLFAPSDDDKPEKEIGFDSWDNESDDDWSTIDDSWDDASWDNDASWDTPAKTDDGGGGFDDFNEDILDYGFFAEPQPRPNGAVIEFFDLTLQMITAYDSVELKNIDTLHVLIKENKAVAKGGSFDWTSVGLEPEVYASFKEYNFKLNSPNLKIEQATMHYPSKIEEPVEGIFEFQSLRHFTDEGAKYPRFMSYKSNVTIKDMGENIRYHGGFSLNGKKVYSSSVSEGNCTITVTHDGEKKFRARAKYFELGDSIITGYPASISIYQGADSIYHPGSKINFNKSKNELKIYKNKGSFKDAPFFDSFHNIEMHLDAAFWGLADTVMHFSIINAKHEIPAYFDSKENFQENKYFRIKGLYPFHSLQMICNYAAIKKQNSFYALDIATHYKQNISTVKSAMSWLAQQGYIDYEPKGGKIILKDKGKHYFLSRKQEKDYDYLSIRSIDPGGGYNSTLNLSDNSLTIRGVDRITVSDSLGVYFYPANREVKLLKNRDLLFDGKVDTKNYQFNGKNFYFNYQDFNVDLSHIDSIKFTVEVRDTITGKYLGRKTLENKLSYSSGLLTLDKPNNKSGKHKNPQFPSFDAIQGAYVYFNGRDILNGAYDTTVHYKIPPFAADSMGAGVEIVGFEGEFVSGGIFPIIDEKLIIMHDLSFGFIHAVPKEGYPMYGGTARFYGSITLDKKGLRGNGVIKYLTTTVESHDFVFYIDGVKALGEKAYTVAGTHPDLPEHIRFPKMEVTDYEMDWKVKSDSMFIKNFSTPFNLFDKGVATMNGIVNITSSTGMLGNGVLETKGALTISQKIQFQEDAFSARNAQFEVLSDVQGKPAVRSDFVKVELDLLEGRARFSPEKQGFASNEFPFLQFKTSIDNGMWDINERKVYMDVPEEEDINKSYFYSTRKSMDSLVFNARSAVYNMDSLKLYIDGVPEVRVADASIIPDKNRLTIRQNSEIEKLHNAVIVIDTVNKYHTLFDGNIRIRSRNKFEGDAYYQYVNFNNDTLPIKFNSFKLVETQISKKKTERHTVSSGAVVEADTFYIGPKILFKGQATMYAQHKALSLNGFVKLDMHGLVDSKNWLKFQTEEGVSEVRVDLSEQEGKIFTGMILPGSSRLPESRFLGRMPAQRDKILFNTGGTLVYDYGVDEFKVGPIEKFRKELYTGSIFGYSEDKEQFHLFGPVNIIENNKERSFKFAGIGTHDLTDTTFDISGLATLQFDMPSQMYSMMGENIKSISSLLGLPKAVVNNDTLIANIANITDEKNALSFLGKHGSLEVVKDLSSAGIVLSPLNLQWSEDKKAWYSVGPIGVSNIDKFSVNAVLNGYLEIRYGVNTESITLFIEANHNAWYYFNYNNSALYTWSSNQEYNRYIESKSTMEKNQMKGAYFYAPGSDFEKSKFIKYFANMYLGGEIPESQKRAIELDNKNQILQNDVEDELFEDQFNNLDQDDEQIEEEEEEGNEEDEY